MPSHSFIFQSLSITMDDILLKGFQDLKLESPLKKSGPLASAELSVPAKPKSLLSIELVPMKCEDKSSPSSLTLDSTLHRTWEVTLGVPGPDFRPGDAISIFCPNYEAEVDLFLGRLKVDGSKEVLTASVTSSSKKVPEHLPSGVSLKDLFLNNLDIRSPPKKKIFKAICNMLYLRSYNVV
ncbi:Uncharacterized protein FKW44_005019 [Caligus rogercresseyi]|uniref:Uncharacterized protein n=1 Tax=Caligus rogercresseyi TaxID=217165 RepID=A0A7T8HMG0_CALRO|nr:Uncharacterized protein FKW44_005019 [Caligus rogercresseyi]